MKRMTMVAALILFGGKTAAEVLPATAATTMTATVLPQARVNVDSQGNILNVWNVTEGINREPAILNIYQDGIKTGMTPQVRTNLDLATSRIDWSRGGLVYLGFDSGIILTNWLTIFLVPLF